MPLGPKASLSALAAAYHSASGSASNSSATSAPLSSSNSYLGTSSYSSLPQPQLYPQYHQVPQAAQQHTLHSAAASKDLVATRTLLKSYASEPTILAAALAQPLHGVLPLHAAASGGNEHIVALLLSYGADPNALLYRASIFMPSNNGTSADASDPHAQVSLADSHPAGPGEEGSTALHFAAAAGHRDVIATLLQNGARADIKDARGVTPEMLATANLHNLCAEILRKAAAGPVIVPAVPTNPSAVSGGPSTPSMNNTPFIATPSTRRERTLSSIRKQPSAIEVNNNAAPPPVTTPTRNFKSQASIEQIAAGMKATFSGWNRTYSNASSPFSNAQPTAGSSKSLGRHSSNPNLRAGSALLAESSASQALPTMSRQALNAQSATRKTSKDKIKERLIEPIRGKDKGKSAAQRQHSASTLVMNAHNHTSRGTFTVEGDGVQDQALLSDDSDSDLADLGFSVAATPPAPNANGQFFIANPHEAVPPLPNSDAYLQTGEEAASARRRPSIPFLAAHPAQAVRAALGGNSAGSNNSGQPSATGHEGGGFMSAAFGRSRDSTKGETHNSAGHGVHDIALHSPRGGSFLGLTTPRKNESNSTPTAAGTYNATNNNASHQPTASPLRSKSLSQAGKQAAEMIEELALFDTAHQQQQQDALARLMQQQSVTGGGNGAAAMQRSSSTSTSASFKSDAASRPADSLRPALVSVSSASSTAAGSPRMQALLLQASAGASSSGAPSSPSRLSNRTMKNRSFPSILRKFGSQSQLQHPSPSLTSPGPSGSDAGSPSVGVLSGSAGTASVFPTSPIPPGTVARQRSADFDGRDRVPRPPPPLPSQSHLRARTSTRSRERVWDNYRQRSRTIAGSAAMEQQRSSHSSDVAREAEDEVRELLSAENPARLAVSVGGSLRPLNHSSSFGNQASGDGVPFSSSASNGSVSSSASSPRIPTLAGLSTPVPLANAFPTTASRLGSTSGSDRESLLSASGFSSPQSVPQRSTTEYFNSPGSSAANKDRRQRASSAGSMARSSQLLRSTDMVSSRQAAQQIFKSAELLLQSPALIETASFTNPSGSTKHVGPASSSENLLDPNLSLADQLLIFGEALARERELTAGASAGTSQATASSSITTAAKSASPRRGPAVKPVSSEPRLSTATFSISSPSTKIVKASPSNDTLPSVQISDSDSPIPPRQSLSIL